MSTSKSKETTPSTTENRPACQRFAILQYFRDAPTEAEKMLTKKFTTSEGNVIRTNVGRPWKLDVSVNDIRATLFDAQQALRTKLEIFILIEKLTRDEVDKQLNNWDDGVDFMWMRSNLLVEFEKNLWESRENQEDEDASPLSGNSKPGNTQSTSSTVQSSKRDNNQSISSSAQPSHKKQKDTNSPSSSDGNDSSSSSNPGSKSSHSDDDLIDRQALPVAVVVNPDGAALTGANRLKIVKNIEELMVPTESMKFVSEARKGNKHGKKILPLKYPGIPSKKYTHTQYTGNMSSNLWPVQCAFQLKDSSDQWMTYYEGWAEPYELTETELQENGAKILFIARDRMAFLKKLVDENIDADGAKSLMFYNSTPKRHLMDYEDLSYFHSVVNEKSGLGTVRYIDIKKGRSVRPPVFRWTTLMIMNFDVYNQCLVPKPHRPIPSLNKKRKRQAMNDDGCENQGSCTCYQTFHNLYEQENSEYLKTTSSGFLEIQDLKLESSRILIECSDACGCSPNCPKRHLQKGSQKPLVVSNEGTPKGFCLRATKDYKVGEFIAEYVGTLKLSDKRDTSYEADVYPMVGDMKICSRDFGNCTRFMAHECLPNAVMITTHSRVYESDALIPRIGVFAWKNISIGDEITIKYFTEKVLKEAAKKKNTGIPCECGHCFGRLPF